MSFESLKQKLVGVPILAYPKYDRDFTLETDASALRLGAVLSQVQDDDHLHPVTYASRALSAPEKNYSITELETLAVVWAVSHFHHHLYGHVVTVVTDHTAVTAVLETPSLTRKHVRWWTRVYGRGVKELCIVYRAGKENVVQTHSLEVHMVFPQPEKLMKVNCKSIKSGWRIQSRAAYPTYCCRSVEPRPLSQRHTLRNKRKIEICSKSSISYSPMSF